METKIDNDYLTNEFGLNLVEKLRSEYVDPQRESQIYLDGLYLRIIGYVCRCDVACASAGAVEARLDDETKRNLFRQAQGFQAQYEAENGVNEMILDGYGAAFDVCRATRNIIVRLLGFNRPTLLTQR